MLKGNRGKGMGPLIDGCGVLALSKKLWILSVLVSFLFVFYLPPAPAQEAKGRPETAQFKIFLDGKEIGEEKFSITVSGDAISSRSVVNLRDVGYKRLKVQLESELSMDSFYMPRSYQLRTNVDGQKGTINGTFTKGEATFEYRGSGNPRQRGLLTGDSYVLLDTNVFHHFIFVARLFDFSANKGQSIEAVIPQELDGGILKVSEIGIEIIQIGGKRRDLRHLRADSGVLQIDLWVDDQRTLYKIAVPSKRIEVIRKS
ncbi:MAG: hypothetical protein QUT30_07735 [Acidobacteriota bacterium]|nr:hypothetical protein [Acidobacteriota bacterium]